ncbi:MAG: diacylglycerol kinase [Deferribacteres bacterium]|nr:diacylglycerol kinase [Deferribacteres bacterium]
MKSDSWSKSVSVAIEGILYAVKSERNLKIHILLSIAVLIAALFLNITPLEYIILAITITLLISFELINTAIEKITDAIFKDKCEEAKRIKDIAAGAVLLSAFGAVYIGYFTVFNRMKHATNSLLSKTSSLSEHIAIVSIAIVVFLVVLIKSFFNKGEPLHGGMPSGHAAVAFSVLISTIYISKNFVIGILVLLLSILVSLSRAQLKIHTIGEVVFGGILGALVTYILFKIFV